MSIMIIRHHRCMCDNPECAYSEEFTGMDETMEMVKSYFKRIGWKFKGRKSYCSKDCSQILNNTSLEDNPKSI